MKHLLVAVGICISLSSVPSASADDVCEAALLPTIEQTQSQKSRIMAYMFLHAEEAWDTYQSKSQKDSGGEVGYAMFEAEFDSSSSREEFREKVNKRLEQENFSLNEAAAQSEYRRSLTPSQLKAWSECRARESGGGGILLSFDQFSQTGILVTTIFRPPTGVGEGTLEVKVIDGAINNKAQFTDRYVGQSTKTYPLKPDRGKKEVLLIVEGLGLSDKLRIVDVAEIPVNPKPPMACHHTYSVIMCGGQKENCGDGDWGVTPIFPTGDGDCIVELQDPELDDTTPIEPIALKSIEAISGDAEGFRFMKGGRHPSWPGNPSINKNLKLCGAAIDSADRRARATLCINYKK